MATHRHAGSTSASGHRRCLVLVCLILVISATFLVAAPVYAAPPVISPPGGILPTGQVGSSYPPYPISAAGGAPPYTWNAVLPTGLSINPSTGVISGTPAVAVTNFHCTVTVTDSTPEFSQEDFYITITERPLSFTTIDLRNATEGRPYTEVIRATGGTLPYTYSLAGGTLPDGLTFRGSSGTISGVPSRDTAGTYSLTVTVTDSSSPALSGQQTFILTIEEGGFEVTVSIGTGLKAGETPVYLGSSNSPVATLQGGETVKLDFDLGVTQYIRVEPIVEHPSESGVRFKAEVDEITVSEYSTDANFPYNAEYSIELKSEPSNVIQLTGSGWYKEGYTLRASATSEVMDQSNQGVQYRFANWKLPTGETLSSRDLVLTVNAPGSCVANYDTYYRLALASPYGEVEGGNWYKAGSTAEWGVKSTQTRMPGILGVFGGRLNAVNTSGATFMDGPKSIDIVWEPDYTRPSIFIPLTIILIGLAIYGIYRLSRGPRARPAAFPPPYQPIPPPPFRPMPPPPPQTTVVMIGGEKQRLGPPTTREQLMEKFGELLERYEEEIKAKEPTQGLPPGARTTTGGKGLPAPELPPPTLVEADAAGEESTACDYNSKRALRVVSTAWRKLASKDAQQLDEEATEESITGPVVVWARDIYQEWEILTCWLPRGHAEKHDGPAQIVYSLLNTVTEVKVYKPEQEPTPPKPHYTDGMPQVDVATREVISADKLPTETTS